MKERKRWLKVLLEAKKQVVFSDRFTSATEIKYFQDLNVYLNIFFASFLRWSVKRWIPYIAF